MSGSRGRPAAPEFAPRVLAELAPAGGGAAMVAGQQIESIGERISRLGQIGQHRLDQAAEEEAQQAGAAAGEQEPGTVMEGGGGLYRRAYNRAAIEAGGRRLEITARQEFERMAREHAADPDAFQRSAIAWRDGVLAQMPEAFRVRVAPTLDAMAAPFLRIARTQQDQHVADERGASFVAALPLRLAAIERAGLRIATDPAARTEADREQAGLRGELVALGPRTAFSFEGQHYPADSTRAGRYNLEQMAEIRRRSQDIEAVALARGAFRTGPQTLAAVEAFERRAEAGEVAGLRPDQARSVADALRRDLAQARAAQTEGQREARAALAPRVDADRAAIAESGAPVGNILDSELSAAGYDVPQYRAQERARMLGWQARQDLAGVDTPARAQEIADRFAPGSALFLADPEAARQVLLFARERGASIRAASLQDTIRDRAAELTAGAGAAVRHAAAVPQEWRPIIAEAARQHGVQEFFGQALLGRESEGRADAVSPAGAQGPAQIMPDTAANPGFGMVPLPRDAIRDPARAIPWALEYYSRLRAHFGGSDELALMAYNWGHRNVTRWIEGGRTGPVPAETRAYVAALLPAAGGDPARSGATLPPIVSPEEAIAAGQTPEWAARASAEAAEAARIAALRQAALTATPEQRRDIEAELAVVGERAAENARAAAAWREVLADRERGMREDPAGYVTATSPILHQLEQRVIQGDATALSPLLDAVRQEQARQGVPEAAQRPISVGLAQGLVQSLMALPTDAERLPALRQMLGQVRMDQQGDVLAALRMSRLPEPVAIAAAVAPRLGEAAASRLLTELTTDVGKLGLTPELTRTVRENTASLMDDSDRVGGLRARQYQATGNADFLERAAQGAVRLRHVVSVRAAASQDASGSVVRGAYEDLYGSHVAMDRRGVLALVPRGVDQAALARGLEVLRDREANRLAPGDSAAARGIRTDFSRGRWMDIGDGQFAYFPQGSPIWHVRPDGSPMVATTGDALGLALGNPSIGAPEPAAELRQGPLAVPPEEQRRRMDERLGIPLTPPGGAPVRRVPEPRP